MIKTLSASACATLLFLSVSAQTFDAIDFTDTTTDGKVYHLFDILDSGKPVILDFFFTTCHPCLDIAKGLEQLWESDGPAGTNCVFICTIDIEKSYKGNTAADINVWKKNSGLTYPFFADEEYLSWNLYHVPQVPYSIVVTPDRKARVVAPGAVRDTLENMLSRSGCHPLAAKPACIDTGSFRKGGTSPTVKDHDGNIYNTVTIGKQVWMKENLKTLTYNNGDSITTTIGDSSDISAETDPKYQWINNYPFKSWNLRDYGRLYTWYAATDSRNICPSGWHLPTDSEWTSMENNIGCDSKVVVKIKEAGSTHWYCKSDIPSDNESGFTLLPGGSRNYYGQCSLAGFYGEWWTSSDYHPFTAWKRSLFCTDTLLDRDIRYKHNGLSVRCVSNTPATPAGNHSLNNDMMKIYPNPANDKITIDCADRKKQTLSIYNLLGTIILQKQLNASTNIIDISALPKGIYTLQFIGIEGPSQHKFVKD